MKEEKPIRATSIKLDSDVYDRLVELARKDKRSISKEIEFIITKHLELRDGQ